MKNALIAGYPIVLPEHRAEFHRQNPDWHKAWLDSIHSMLKPDDVLMDLGSEQGDMSALYGTWLDDGGVILCEPVAGFWPTIRATFEANGLLPWGCVPAFASDEISKWGEVDEPGWPIESNWAVNDDPGFQHLNERSDLPSFTVDAFVERTGITPTAMTIDVEGAELKALRGAEELLADNQPTVWVAIHPEIMQQRYSHTPNELLAFMFRLGYRWDFLDFAGELHFVFTRR